MNSSNKSFGIVFGIFFLIIGSFSYFKAGLIYNKYFLISFIFFFISFTFSNIFSPLNKIWLKFGVLLGKLIEPFIMFLIYFFVIHPTRVVLIIFRKDVLNLKISKEIKTYWTKKDDNKFNANNQF